MTQDRQPGQGGQSTQSAQGPQSAPTAPCAHQAPGALYRSPLQAIKAYCLDCSGGSAHEVRLCPAKRCPLFPFRTGRSPNRAKRELTEEQREKLRETFARNRARSNDRSGDDL